MAKEKVIVFDGEDKFIAPRNKVYDVAKGKANYVNQVGTEPTAPRDDAFTRYMIMKGQEVVIPQPSDADFCNKIQAFIRDSGGGRATPDQVMTAYQLFQNNCLEKPKAPVAPPVEDIIPPAPQPSVSEVSFPNWQLLGCADLDSEIASIENTLATSKFDAATRTIYNTALSKAKAEKSRKCTAPPPSATTPTPPAPSPKVEVPILLPVGSPALGMPPMGGGGGFGGGGGSEEEVAQAPAKKSNFLIYALVGVGLLYLLTRKSS